MKLAIVGAGGHGRELAEIAMAATNGRAEISFWDDNFEVGDHPFGPVRGSVAGLVQSEIPNYLIGIGDPNARRAVATTLSERATLVPFTAVHPTASVGARCELGSGSVIGPSSVLTCDISVGEHTHLHSNVVVAHDCTIGSYVVITPGVSVAGDVTIGDAAWLGVGSTINRGLTVGSGALVGAGAVAIANVQASDIVAGVPARSLNPEHQR